ncbi:type III-B CRISPR module RAMP protein Cmr4 [Thermotoga profunda]|uniref:type III-B CRISPR module RAMP protein Cmr4 n=1 Tax=Thermotoga profunda TaxID=1508420 RepID=UPI0018E075C7|nr:type III-B CRISPR module RAMP protein Cmr4 [Thermotoga profunda]
MLSKIYARTLDPIHIGTGGYRLGRVDNTIVRDPATDVPKIPGTSIAGVIKAFAEIVKEEDEKKSDADKKLKDINIEELFGTETKKGALHFYDGQIIFFPVSSIQGTVWITTKELLRYWFGVKDEISDNLGDKALALCGIDTTKPLNLGWLLLEIKKNETNQSLPSQIVDWVKRIVVVSDKLFSHIVNDNLEVRTSVRIDKDTGTAVERALFTYEAIPRGTIFGFEICLDRTRNSISGDVIKIVMNVVDLYLKNLGIGGMGTRGFGRLEILKESSIEKSSGV